jgi:hypothetical protein
MCETIRNRKLPRNALGFVYLHIPMIHEFMQYESHFEMSFGFHTRLLWFLRYFQKAIQLEHNFVEGWIAYGHSFALQDETDQALAAYRTATRLFPGAYQPWLYIGMEYSRSNNLELAEQCLEFGENIDTLDLMGERPGRMNADD